MLWVKPCSGSPDRPAGQAGAGVGTRVPKFQVFQGERTAGRPDGSLQSYHHLYYSGISSTTFSQNRGGNIMTNNQYGAKVYPYEATECKFLWGALAPAMYLWGTRGQTTATGEIFWASRERESTFHIRFSHFGQKQKYSAHRPNSGIPGFSRRILALTGLFRLIWLGCPGLSVPVFRLLIPLVNVALEDSKLPLSVELEAFTPFYSSKPLRILEFPAR